MTQADNTPQTEASAGINQTETTVMPSMEEQLQAAELKGQEHYDAWMYAKAEGENIRRRAADDISKAQKFAVERFSNEMLAVMDSLQAALAVENTSVESFKSGMELTLKQLTSVFRKISHYRDQSGRRKTRPAQASGDQHGRQRPAPPTPWSA